MTIARFTMSIVFNIVHAATNRLSSNMNCPMVLVQVCKKHGLALALTLVFLGKKRSHKKCCMIEPQSLKEMPGTQSDHWVHKRLKLWGVRGRFFRHGPTLRGRRAAEWSECPGFWISRTHRVRAAAKCTATTAGGAELDVL